MTQKTLGIDLGTNSLGLAIRNIDAGSNIIEQLEYYTSIIFKSGVGNGQKGEYSYAAERTKYRSSRRLYQARKYRIWATLEVLIDNGCCPLTHEQLKKWSVYDKAKGLKRQYPTDAFEFEQWVRLDFDNDGIPEYRSPYQLRAELVTKHLDWNSQTDRYKFGRAMYHIAQRRGFKSSKGETLKESSENEDIETIEVSTAMKKSENKKSQILNEYMVRNNLPTAGCAFAKLELDGIRVRGSEYQAVQSQLLDEVKQICTFQKIDQLAPELFIKLTSTKKNEGTIFFRRPLRSQKSLIGNCTLEPTHKRCPISHPDYELFRAFAFINNIKFRTDHQGEWQSLNNKEREDLFKELFTRTKATFKFKDIREWIEKKHKCDHLSYNNHTINYNDNATVAGCPIISRLKKILGDEWNNSTIKTDRTRINRNTGDIYTVEYSYIDIWHIALCCDDFEELSEFSTLRMGFDERQASEYVRLWSSIQDGYASLSLKAIHNILPFLQKGFIYNEAVAFAKIPDIIGAERWNNDCDKLITSLQGCTADCDRIRLAYSITNTLISRYKARSLDEQPAYRNTEYKLDDADRNDILNCIIETISEHRWKTMDENIRISIKDSIEANYQKFFADSKRDYYKLPNKTSQIREFLEKTYPDVDPTKWDSLYHHSQISLFPLQTPQNIRTDKGNFVYVCQLGTPDIGSIKNPVALRALHTLRRAINYMLMQGMIDEETRVVVETARDLNDANWRKAIERYQKEREKENEAIASIIKEFRPGYSDTDIEKGRLLFEQNILDCESRNEKAKAERFAADMQKYRLWKEQKFQCLYTGQFINISELFDENRIDIEHTIPRSISFDDSLKNKTVCVASFNRNIKGNNIPSDLSNYSDILLRIRPWQERVDHIKDQIELWRGKSRTATTLERKNECIQQRHLWELELDYWQTKLNTFTIKKDELDIGFRNRQLSDTRIITKYAFHYLKSVFSRVDVQKGRVTADFRKILGIQSADDKKNRNRHSHHAIDAAVLTMIPVAAQRDKMIQLFYQMQEAPTQSEREAIRIRLNKEISTCRIGSINHLVETIENNILINHVSKDQTLTPARKPRRIGKHIVKGQWLQGDSIRGSLHKDTFYGAIKSSNGILMVVRKPLASLNEKDIESIIDLALRKAIESQIYTYITTNGFSFAKAIEQPIYMTDKNGQPVTHDCNGRPLAPIRHVRCYAKAGRGYLKQETALQIKQQTYLSKHDHKIPYYAQNDDNYLCLFYEGVVKNKIKKEFKLVNYYDVAQLKISNSDILFHEPAFATYEGNGLLSLKAIIKNGTKVLLFKESEEELFDLDINELSKRLYVTYKFNETGTPNIYLRHHLEARKESECDISEKGSAFNPQTTFSYLTLKASNFNAIIEHYGFEVDPIGNIVFDKSAI